MMHISLKKNVLYFLMLVLFVPFYFVQAATNDAVSTTVGKPAQLEITNTALLSKVAPGDDMPITIKLLNFGGGKKVDAIITYKIRNQDGTVVDISKETVAVETTASFVKSFHIVKNAKPGIYTIEVSIEYQGQLVPATTQFSFVVENKIFGLFFTDFWLYVAITLLFGLLIGIFGRTVIRRNRVYRLSPLDYSSIASSERVFYELLSDTILGMRKRVGDIALDLAYEIDGLEMEKNTGRVLNIKDDPAKIIARLVTGYEQALGKKVSFSFRQNSLSKRNS